MIVRSLLAHKAKVNVADASGKTPLEKVMSMPGSEEARSIALLSELLQYQPYGKAFGANYPVLSKAAHDGKMSHAQKIITHDMRLVNVVPISRIGFKPALHEAVHHGHEALVDMLCSRDGTNINLADQFGNSALHQAIISKRNEMIPVLIKKGADKEFANLKNGFHRCTVPLRRRIWRLSSSFWDVEPIHESKSGAHLATFANGTGTTE
jgi:ankyrin repeat protein